VYSAGIIVDIFLIALAYCSSESHSTVADETDDFCHIQCIATRRHQHESVLLS
jgi:hypothetical protein